MAENGFKIKKHQILNKELKLMIPRFIQINEEMVSAKLKERFFPLTTTRQKNNSLKKEKKKRKLDDDDDDAGNDDDVPEQPENKKKNCTEKIGIECRN